MNNFLSKLNSNLLEPTRLLFLLKKCGTGGVTNRTCMLRNSVSGNMLNVSTRTISTSYRFQVSFVYTVTLKTGDMMGAGTDSKVYLRMIGSLGSTDEIMLKTGKNDLERGRVDHYNIPSDNVGPLKKIIIRHDNTGFAPGWFLDWVRIRDGKGKKYNFKCGNWLIRGEAYGNIKLLKEDNYVDKHANPYVVDDDKNVKHESKEETADEDVSTVEVAVEDLVKSNTLDNEILQDLKGLEELSTSGITEDLVEYILPEKNDSQASTVHEHPQSTRHAMSLSPAVRNLLETYNIDMSKIPSSGRDSRVLKGDVLAYMLKENITKKKFVVNMMYPVDIKQEIFNSKSEDIRGEKEMSGKDTVLESLAEESYLDHITSENKKIIDQELQMSKFEIPHLYMSISCPVDKLNTFTSLLENRFFDQTRNVVLVCVLCQSLLDTGVSNSNDVDILVTHNGSSVILRNCCDADIENVYQQYKHFEDRADNLMIPKYGLNIVDTDGVSQLSSILVVGQVISLNISGAKLSVGASGKIEKSVTVAISCDSRVISEVKCALLLLNCKKYLSNPDLLGL